MRDHEMNLEASISHDGTPLGFTIECILQPIIQFGGLLYWELQSDHMKFWLNRGKPCPEMDADQMLDRAMLFLNQIAEKGQDLKEVLSRINIELVARLKKLGDPDLIHIDEELNQD